MTLDRDLAMTGGIGMVRPLDGGSALCTTTSGPHPLAGVVVRPLAPGQTGPLLEVFAGMSPRSRLMRFLGPLPQLGDDALRRLTDVDHDWHGCWYATVGAATVGVGRYVRVPAAPQVAEIALEVVDRYQGRGIGRLLLGVVGTAAADVGVVTLSATMDAENARVRRLAAQLGGCSWTRYGVVERRAPVPVMPQLASARVARGARVARRHARALRAA